MSVKTTFFELFMLPFPNLHVFCLENNLPKRRLKKASLSYSHPFTSFFGVPFLLIANLQLEYTSASSQELFLLDRRQIGLIAPLLNLVFWPSVAHYQAHFILGAKSNMRVPGGENTLSALLGSASLTF